jgi:hypothetical protein
MTFLQWLRQQRHRPDPVGDLACDALNDRHKPTGQVTLRQWQRYLQGIPACDGALKALHRAWDEYRQATALTPRPQG